MTTNEAGLEIRGLRKSYGDVEAVRGVSFAVPPGQVCGLLGPNGAGKSTTLKMIAGILDPDDGSVQVAGHDLASEAVEAKRALGFLPESGALYSLLSAREHLALLSDLYELDPAEAAERAGQLLDVFGIEELAGRRIDTLSKGQRQKVALVTALLHDPQVVLLDEPLNGLDAASVRLVRDVVRKLAERGRAVIYCSHILDVVERVCDRAVILDRGVVVADSPTSELTAAGKRLEETFHQLVTTDDIDELAGVFAAPRAASKSKGKGKGKGGKRGKR